MPRSAPSNKTHEKQVRISYWVNGIQREIITKEREADSAVTALRCAGASRIHVLRGKTAPVRRGNL